ncbi:hypothetical protein WKI71_22360 [Streptomyces sp. MS1.AVA.1]|uniref:Uncharacterized protein n=1 Tax=Streptomyces machairae TaxID=3134109 RepID=A0ABU8UMM1_9ACTN
MPLPSDRQDPVAAPRTLSRREAQAAARTQALTRVCAGFTTTISPHSAARLADLMSTTTYAKAA